MTVLIVPHRLNLPDTATICTPSNSSLVRDGHEHTTAPHVLLAATTGSRDTMPRLQVSLLMPTCALHMVYLLKRHRCDLVYVYIYLSHAPQPHVSTTQVGTHHARSATTGKRTACTALAGTHNLAFSDSRAGSVPFPKPRALVLPLVHFGQSKPEGHSGLDTADSDLMHHQFRLSLLQWNPRPARRNPTNIVSAACGKFHAVILQEPVIMFRTSLISSLHTLATRTSPSCSTRTPSSPTLWLLPSGRAPQAKVREVWSYLSFEAYCDALHFLEHRRLRFALFTSITSWPRNVTLPLISYDGYMAI